MMPLKISEVRKSRVEDLKFKSAAVKRAGWPCFPVVPLSRFYGASNARNAAYECTRLKSADDMPTLFLSPFLPFTFSLCVTKHGEFPIEIGVPCDKMRTRPSL